MTGSAANTARAAMNGPSASKEVDVVVVSYNSSGELRGCIAPLAEDPRLRVIVVDNASTDGSLETIRDLPVERIQLERNRGFAYGCNRGWERGSAADVLFLNPDARIDPASLERLVEVLRESSDVAATAPRVVDASGHVDYSLRRFPRLRSTFAQALFLHRLFSHAPWADELVRDSAAYDRQGPAEWVSGACLAVRRHVLEELGGWDEGFFLYCEDIDLCRRIHDLGYEIEYVPSATVVHRGGASVPRASLLPTLAASRVRYASKHRDAAYALLERLGIALGSATHLIAGCGGVEMRRGHARALAVAAGITKNAMP